MSAIDVGPFTILITLLFSAISESRSGATIFSALPASTMAKTFERELRGSSLQIVVLRYCSVVLWGIATLQAQFSLSRSPVNFFHFLFPTTVKVKTENHVGEM